MSDAGHAHRLVPTIGLVGGIASGKSEVRRLLEDAGCVASDSDALGHEALRNAGIAKQIHAWWGDRAIRGGVVDRGALAAIVFADPAARVRLESLVHPWISARRAEQFASAPAATVAFVIDAPLLLEAGLLSLCDSLWFVEAPFAVRLARAQADRGWSAAELESREGAQWPLDQKRALAHHVLRNDSDPKSLRSQVEAALAETLRKHAAI